MTAQGMETRENLFDRARAEEREALCDLHSAAMRVPGADLWLMRLLERIFIETGGGRADGCWAVSHAFLAASPVNLFCSLATARRTVEKAKRAGLIVSREYVPNRRGEATNGYAIHWPGVRALLHGQAAESGQGPGASTTPPCGGALIEHPPALTEHPPALTEQGSINRNRAGALSLSLKQTEDDDDKTSQFRAACSRANAARKRLFPNPDYPLRPADREFLFCCALLAERFGPDWFEPAVECAARKAKDPIAYLRRTLSNRLVEHCAICGREEAGELFARSLQAVRPRAREFLGRMKRPATPLGK